MANSPLELTNDELEKRMRPGALSELGFLGEHEQLDQVIAHDARVLHELNTTYEKLAERLEDLLYLAFRSDEKVSQFEHFLVTVTQYMGFQLCPWTLNIHHGQCRAGKGVRFASLDWQIQNLRTNQVMSGPGLIVHLIREHHFFEGLDSPYRVDPYQLACLLELRSLK